MPQFDLSSFVPQLAWLTVFFAILYFGIVRATLPKLGRTIAAREDQVNGDIATAEAAKATADAMATRYAAGVDAAHASARSAVDAAKAKAAAAIEASLAKSGAVLAEKLAAADAALAETRGKALAEIESVAREAAGDIVERLTGVRPDSGAIERAATQAVAG